MKLYEKKIKKNGNEVFKPYEYASEMPYRYTVEKHFKIIKATRNYVWIEAESPYSDKYKEYKVKVGDTFTVSMPILLGIGKVDD